MNLIEQLGGYGKAKKALIDAQNSNDIDPIIYINDQEVLTDCVCDALIQYRRENNIFENGDWIVILTMELGNRLVHKITEITENMIEVGGSCIYKYEARHATDKEIAQWYRDE